MVKVEENTEWSLAYAVDSYTKVKELEGFILWKSKKEFSFSEFKEFAKRLNRGESSLLKKINYFEAQKSFHTLASESDISEYEAIDVVTDKSNPISKISESTYTELRGDTPEERVEFYEKVSESVLEEKGKYRPSRQDIRDYKAQDAAEEGVADSIVKETAERLTEKEAIAQTNKEFSVDYYKLCSGGFDGSLGVLNIGFEIHKFDNDWKEIKKILSKVAHSDVNKEVNDKAMKFISVLNMIFRDKKKDEKSNKLKKDMTERIVTLMGVKDDSK